MKYTTKLNLKKPDLTDYVNIADLNDNMDILDNAVGNAEEGLAAHMLEEATLTKAGHVQLNSDINSADETKAATPNAVKKVSDKIDTRLNEVMPLQFTDQGKTFRWGFRVVNGEPQIIYEEVV